MRKRLLLSIGTIMILGILGILVFVLMTNDEVDDRRLVDDSETENSGHVDDSEVRNSRHSSCPDVTYEEDQIIIINRYVNYAAGYQDEGFFIDVNGRVYFYCFSQLVYQEVPDTDEDFLIKLKDIQQYAEPLMTIDDSVMSEAINLCFQIDAAETYEKELTAYDAGDRILYVCNDADMIPCRQIGDYEGALDSVSARNFIEYFDNTLMQEISSYCGQMTEEEYAAGKVYYYTENALYFVNEHCGYLSNIEYNGMYVVTNEEERAALERILGSDFGIAEWQNQIALDCIFFVEAVNVSTGGYNLKRKGIMSQGRKFVFIPSEDSKVPNDGEMVTEAFDGFVFVAAFPKVVADTIGTTGSECFTDFCGNEWIHPN
ncbi:MAG: hypothetical protein ACI4DU_04795 [Lachnospiraceae bacterium]